MNIQLADLSVRDIAGTHLCHDTQVTLGREGHMADISVELYQGIGPVGPSGGQLGELLSCAIYGRNPSLVGCTHTMASLFALSPTTPFLGSTSRKGTSLWNFSASPHAFRCIREASSDWVTWATLNHCKSRQMLCCPQRD